MCTNWSKCFIFTLFTFVRTTRRSSPCSFSALPPLLSILARIDGSKWTISVITVGTAREGAYLSFITQLASIRRSKSLHLWRPRTIATLSCRYEQSTLCQKSWEKERSCLATACSLFTNRHTCSWCWSIGKRQQIMLINDVIIDLLDRQ